MAGESQDTLVFESEEARQAAMDALDESPENEVKLDEIMKAPIKGKDDAAANNPADPTPVAEPVTPTPEPATPVQPTPAANPDEVITIKRGELPQGFDSFGKFAKSYTEAQALVERQQKFIQEKLSGSSGDQTLAEALQRAQRAEAELASVRQKTERPAQQETREHRLTDIPQSFGPKIKETRQKLIELSSDPIANEDQIFKLRLDLDDYMIQENDRNALLIERAQQRAEAAERKAIDAESKTTGYLETTRKTEEQKRAEETLANEYKEMDGFSSSYSEFKLSRPSREIESEYASWGKKVAELFYGGPVDIQTPNGQAAMKQALSMLERGAPSIVEKCTVAGIATQPPEDVKKYLEMCDLLDYRDGYRVNPNTGQKELVQRFHGPSGKMVPDSFPDLKAAYEDRKIREGYYEKKIKDAFVKGGQQMAQAISQRDSGTVEMDHASGVSRQDAGLTMKRSEAEQLIDTIDEADAMRRYRAGDPSLLNKLNEAFRALGQPSLTI
jgi:hypothetical protein